MAGPPIAVVGLGIMGSRLAERLIGAGFAVRGHDPDPDRAAAFTAMGGAHLPSPAAAAEGCDLVVLSLLTSDISRHVCLGESGIGECPTRPLLVLDTTTGRPEDGVEIAAALQPLGIGYADMTISGNAAVAERGELVVMFGGAPADRDRAVPVMEAIGRSHHHVGPVGAAARMKLIVNHVLAVNRSALAEGLVVAEMAGLDLASTLDVLADSAARSGALELWGRRMVEADHEHPNARLSQSHKDTRLMVEQARALGAPSEMIEAVERTLGEGVSTGLGDLDNSSTIEVVRRRVGRGRIEQGGRDER
jgi:3-hydroxyisobutyrate dehydrogenase-like beta-hydroxyacid dehydrogenase